jgi:pyruvate,water dikinase
MAENRRKSDHTLVADEWNDSFNGDFLWTNSNFCEALGDVLTPATRSMWDIYIEAVPFQVPGYPLVGVIGGRPYINLSVLTSVGRMLGMDPRKMLQRSEDLWGRVPEGVEIPELPLARWQLWRTLLPARLRVRKALRVSQRMLQAFIAGCPEWCVELRARIRQAAQPAELADMWRAELRPYFGQAWRYGRAALESDLIGRLRHELIGLASRMPMRCCPT